jgi:hypothetical protein
MLSWKLDEFLAQGNEMFEYMTRNYKSMFDGDSILRHFDIRYGTYSVIGYEKEIRKKYNDDIQKELIAWIQTEFKSGRLFDKSLWKPVRDAYDISDMFFGYTYFFQYKEYYFQLALYYECLNCKYCKYCDIDNETDEPTIHFELALYGWKNENSDTLQPANKICILHDNRVPESFWNRYF